MSDFIDDVPCAVCRGRVRRTVAMVKRGTRAHAGSCAAALTRETLWKEDRLDGHMAMMRRASAASRKARTLARLAAVAPGVDVSVALAIWESGYQAGFVAKRRQAEAP